MSEKEKNIVVNEGQHRRSSKGQNGFLLLDKGSQKGSYPCWSKYSYDYRCLFLGLKKQKMLSKPYGKT